MSREYKAVIFDMDGTILNTAGDLTSALNYALEAAGHRHDYSEEEVRRFFGSGIHEAIARAFAEESGSSEDEGTEDKEVEGEKLKEEEIRRVQKIFVPYYAAHCDILTDSYPGVREAIRALRAGGLRTAVVSNKPDAAVRKLAERYFAGLFDLAVGEQEGIRRKPAPDMTRRVLRELGVSEAEAVYVGDSEVDLQTAANAGLPCISCIWGFRSREFLLKQGAAHLAESAEDIARLLRDM